jgi:hypothetical protein
MLLPRHVSMMVLALLALALRHQGVTEKHEATSANAAAAAATDLPIDPFVDKCAKALAFGYEDAWPYSSFNRPGLIIMLLNNNKRNKET